MYLLGLYLCHFIALIYDYLQNDTGSLRITEDINEFQGEYIPVYTLNDEKRNRKMHMNWFHVQDNALISPAQSDGIKKEDFETVVDYIASEWISNKHL